MQNCAKFSFNDEGVSAFAPINSAEAFEGYFWISFAGIHTTILTASELFSAISFRNAGFAALVTCEGPSESARHAEPDGGGTD